MKTITDLTQKPIVMKIITTMRILFFVLGVVTTISTSQLFNSCNQPKTALATPTMQAEPLNHAARQQAAVMATYDQRIAALQSQNTELQTQVADTKTALARSHRKSTALEAQLQQQVGAASSLTDTTQRLMNCDSLAQTAAAFLQSAAQKDSLYDSLTSSLQRQVATLDSAVVVREQQHNYLQLNYDRNLAQQQLLLSDNLGLSKQVKRQRMKNKLLSAGLLILGSTATYMALHH